MNCRLCDGSGLIRCADLYRNVKTGLSYVAWELAPNIACPCSYRKAV